VGRRKDVRFVPIHVDLLNKVIEISRREDKPVSALIQEALEESMKAYELRGSLRDMVDEYKLIKTLKETGAVIVPADVLYYPTEKLFVSERETLLERWYEAGQWYGKYLQAKFRDQDVVEVLKNILSACAWNITELGVSRKDGNVEFRCVAPSLSMEGTELFSKYLEGIMGSLGYRSVKRDSLKGFILVEFRKK